VACVDVDAIKAARTCATTRDGWRRTSSAVNRSTVQPHRRRALWRATSRRWITPVTDNGVMPTTGERADLLPIVRGKSATTLTAGEFAALRAGRDRTVVDVGAGDGRAVYRLARAQPSWLVIGLDPAWQRMAEMATRSARKPDKGGAPNALYVRGVAEEPPPPLYGVADELHVMLPWGRLLTGLVLGEPALCGGLRRMAAPGASMDVTVGTDIWRAPVPVEIRELPELTVDHVGQVLRPRLAAAGWHVEVAELLTGTEAGRLPSSWGRRLADRGRAQATFMHLRVIGR
jgi:16S rRNA (adenine(1408)-N(1))-methyltransferase